MGGKLLVCVFPGAQGAHVGGSIGRVVGQVCRGKIPKLIRTGSLRYVDKGDCETF